MYNKRLLTCKAIRNPRFSSSKATPPLTQSTPRVTNDFDGPSPDSKNPSEGITARLAELVKKSTPLQLPLDEKRAHIRPSGEPVVTLNVSTPNRRLGRMRSSSEPSESEQLIGHTARRSMKYPPRPITRWSTPRENPRPFDRTGPSTYNVSYPSSSHRPAQESSVPSARDPSSRPRSQASSRLPSARGPRQPRELADLTSSLDGTDRAESEDNDEPYMIDDDPEADEEAQKAFQAEIEAKGLEDVDDLAVLYQHMEDPTSLNMIAETMMKLENISKFLRELEPEYTGPDVDFVLPLEEQAMPELEADIHIYRPLVLSKAGNVRQKGAYYDAWLPVPSGASKRDVTRMNPLTHAQVVMGQQKSFDPGMKERMLKIMRQTVS